MFYFATSCVCDFMINFECTMTPLVHGLGPQEIQHDLSSFFTWQLHNLTLTHPKAHKQIENQPYNSLCDKPLSCRGNTSCCTDLMTAERWEHKYSWQHVQHCKGLCCGCLLAFLLLWDSWGTGETEWGHKAWPLLVLNAWNYIKLLIS